MSDLPQVHPTVVHMLAEAARQVPEREALVCQGERLSYAQYLRCVAWFADELVALGARDKRVGIVLGNSLDICIAMFAIHAAGAQAVPCNPLYTARELRDIFADADIHVLIPADHTREMIAPIAT